MPKTADAMIAALDAFTPDPDDDDENQFQLQSLMEGFKALADRERVVPAMFALMERFPNADLGMPGPLVRNIESLGVGAYEEQLVASVRRQPAELNVWMLNRILNSNLEPDHRKALLDILSSVPGHASVPARVAESAIEFMRHQAEQETR